MQFILVVTLLVLAGVGALFLIKGSDLLLLGTIATVIIGFFFALSRIAKENS